MRNIATSGGKTRFRLVSLLFFILVVCFPHTRAQGLNASVIGAVTDESGAAMPGVTLTLTSPALQVPQIVATTDEKGNYRITELPIGTYSIRYELSGFQTIDRQGIRLTAGFVAKMDVTLKIGGVEESVTVSGASPVVDVTSAASSVNFTRETLEALPTTRNGELTLAQESAGVRVQAGTFDIGGSQFTSPPPWNNFGRVGDNWQLMEGVAVMAGGSGVGNYSDFSGFEEAKVQVIGNGAQMPGNGVWVNTIVKSGGNAFHGSGFYSLTGPWAQSTNIDDTLRAQGVAGTNKLVQRYDFDGDLGGFLVENKLWFYASARRALDDPSIIGAALKPDGEQGDAPRGQAFWTGKLSYQMTPNQKFIGVYEGNWKYNIRGVGPFNTWESRVQQDQYGQIHKLEYQGVFGKSVTVSALYGYWDYTDPNNGFGGTDVSSYDVATLKYTGDALSSWPVPMVAEDFRYTAKGTIAWFKPDFFHGSHEFKGGLEYGPGVDDWGYFHRLSGDYYQVFRNGAPFEVATTNAPVHGISNANYAGGYIQDNWTMGRLTLDLGLRFDHNNAFIPAQSRPAGTFAQAADFPAVQFPTWNEVGPRLHLAYDLTGHAKTVIKGGWGRFNKNRWPSVDTTPANPYSITTTIYTWHDLNGNKVYDLGEANLSLTGPDFISQSPTANVTASTAISALRIPNPGELSPKTDEFSVNLEHELLPNMAVRISGVFMRDFNLRELQVTGRPPSAFNIPVTNRDPVTNTPVTYYEYDPSLRPASFAVTTPVTVPGLRNITKGLELALTKRHSNNWQAMASYGRIWRDYDLRSDFTQQDPNSLLFAGDRTTDWYAKVGGSYFFSKAGILAAANFNAVKGAAYQRTLLETGGKTITSIVLPVEDFGTRFYPNAYLLDLRAEKTVRIAGPHQLAVRVDLFNALNANTVITLTNRTGPSFGLPTAILPSRIAQFGFTYKF